MTTDIDNQAEALNHAATYHRFMLGVKWVAIGLATTIVFLTLWFGTDAGFVAGLVAGAIVFAAGVIAMRSGLAHSTEEGSLAGMSHPSEAGH